MPMTRKSIAIPLALAAVLAAAAAHAEVPIGQQNSTKGKVLSDTRGMTLYTFDNDQGGTPSCYAGCAKNWPPLLAATGAMAEGDFGLAPRSDGTAQWTYHGRPLYTWINDHKAGDITGDGIKGLWHIAQPK